MELRPYVVNSMLPGSLTCLVELEQNHRGVTSAEH